MRKCANFVNQAGVTQIGDFLCPKFAPDDLTLVETLIMPDFDPDQHAEQYLQLLHQHERTLAAYVRILVTDRADAEDILQVCKITMWKQFAKFEPGTNFVAWGRQIALHQILNYRRSETRRPVDAVEPGFLESIAAEIDRLTDTESARSEALRQCVARLPEAQRKTLTLRYEEDRDIAEIAEQTGRTEAAVYRLLSRIRQQLNDCIQERLRLLPS